MIARLLCRIVGHRWRVLRENADRAILLMHLNSMAGCDADCTRCGYEWRDAYRAAVSP